MFPDMNPRMIPLEGDELKEVTAAFQPIADLKPGDRVKYRKGYKITKFPGVGVAVTVHRTMNIPEEQTNSFVRKEDFTVLVKDEDGDYLEFGFDSRRFERVE